MIRLCILVVCTGFLASPVQALPFLPSIALEGYLFGAATLAWNTQTHDFGAIERGTPVRFKFEFTNRGENPASIRDIRTSCGCTAVDHSEGEIAPGEAGFVWIEYNAARAGRFRKTVQVLTDDGEHINLTITGEVNG